MHKRVLALLALLGCGEGAIVDDDFDFGLEDTELAPGASATALGDPFPELTRRERERFEDGLDEFAEEETIADGLGPVFNDVGCAACHSIPAVGGSSDVTVTRFGRRSGGRFYALDELGGSLIQDEGLGTVNAPDGTSCDYIGEVPPAEADVVARRLTTPLFGLGLVNAVADDTFFAIAEFEVANDTRTAGRPNLVVDLASGAQVVGKLGWKGQNPNLAQFAADAYLNEMGITSPLFPDESCPQGDCALLACDPTPDPEDDGEDVAAFTDFMRMLAPPPRKPLSSSAQAGRDDFVAIGCAACHMPRLKTGPSSIAAFDRRTFYPYSDFLLHDMGSLGDKIEQGIAGGHEMRTAPLWGLSARPRLLHDGRAATVADAILAHDGQGGASRDRFAALVRSRRDALLAFLASL